MSRLCIATRGIGSWRERLASPDTQWQRRYSAFETAVSWECASSSASGLPEPIVELFRETIYAEARVIIAIAEHKVPLPGGRAESQCDVWAALATKSGGLSLSVEAKAKEPFGQNNLSLANWLIAGDSEQSLKNRRLRWDHIRKYLPTPRAGGYSEVAYQLLHRCASAVIEAKRIGTPNAAFIVQAFESPQESFQAFARMCDAIGIKAERGRMQMTDADFGRLGIGWADCPFATDEQVASVV
jgi:hypothetical protein